MDNKTRKIISGILDRRKHPGKYIISGIGTVSKNERALHEAGSIDPAVYVGTYAKYNNGNLYGQWVNIASFDSYNDFMNYLYQLHSDEYDPEFMMQDYQNFPEEWYYEGGMSEDTFDRIKEYSRMENQEAFAAYLHIFGADADIDEFDDRYEGEYSSKEDFAESLVEEIGMENIQNKELYFDYEKFARDLFMDYYFEDGFVFRAY